MASNTSNFQNNMSLVQGSPSSFSRLLKWFVRHGWFVYASSHIHLTLNPAQAYQILATAAKPSAKRLGLRKLFNRGRRYFIRESEDGGFQMMTTSRVWWNPRRRTQATSILSGRFEKIDDTVSRLSLRSRIKLRYLLGQFFLPTFIASIIIFLDWNPFIIFASIVGMYGFSWAAHRLTAQLEAHEIAYFIETVLNDFRPEPPQLLEAGTADVVLEDDFASEWDRYVEEKRGE